MHKEKLKKNILIALKWIFIYAGIHGLIFASVTESLMENHSLAVAEIYFNSLLQFEITALLCTYTGFRVSMFFQDKTYIIMLLMIMPYILLASLLGILLSLTINAIVYSDLVTFSESYANFPRQIPQTIVITIVLSLVFSRIGYLEYQVKLGSARKEETIFDPVMEKSATNSQDNDNSSLTFKVNDNYYMIPFHDIIYISAHNKNIVIHTSDKDFKTPVLLKEIATKLPAHLFFRIHKSFIVNLSLISHIQYFMGGSYLAFLKDEDETNLPVGRTYAPLLKAKLHI